MKKSLFCFLFIFMLTLMVVLSACSGSVNLNLAASEGLAYSLLSDGTYEVSIGDTKDKNIGIPDKYEGIAVTKIKESGFSGSDIVSVVLPDNLVKVDDEAFSGCKKLKVVTNYSNAKNKGKASAESINDRIESERQNGYFGYNSFAHCQSLEELIIPEGVVVLGTACVKNGANLKKVVMPDTVKYILGAAFEGCDSIDEFVFSENIEFLGMGAFYNTKWLINQEDGCIYVGKCLYQYKGEVPSEITVKEGTIEISTEFCSDYYGLSQGLSNLTTLNCNSDLERIGAKAFQSCINLQFVNFNGSTPTIEIMAFYNTKYSA